ncbi:MAG: NTPase [Promethearchaeota archaeon]
MNYFITGKPGSGKTTVCTKMIVYLKERGIKCGGIISKEIRRGKYRVGFQFIDIETGKRFPLASTSGQGPRIGKYFVDLDGIKKAIESIENSDADVLFIDELGPMELKHHEFENAVTRVMSRDKVLVVVVHRRFANRFNCIEVTKENRDQLPCKIAEDIYKNLR